ncbi:hypothetical protein KPL71_020892 [Citrus sinensis]|uniref:Uncharacterized protein n=1 Tax=Citrus sinensis TaxID=2711 RepID=A0ACB8JDS7_CITSI|nr:hypothetical protein KPL71_020892 [Citrus sinensis]
MSMANISLWLWNSCNIGCLGCFIRPPVNTSASNLSKELGVPGRSAGKRSISEDFWTTSTCDMDNSAVQSQGSISSLGTNNLIPDTNGGSGSASAPSEFVNHGFLLWNQTRQRWIGNKKAENRTHQVREPKLNWNATYESLLGSNKPFPQPIPLSEMVDFLVDIWEQEGMYD